MPEVLQPDLCVIGAGSGGIAVALGAAAAGMSVVLVEKGAMGGDSLNAGSVASKALVAAAHAAHSMREAGRFGIGGVEPRVDWSRTRRHLRDAVAAAAPDVSAQRLAAARVRVVRAAGRFVSRDTCEAGDVRIRARRFAVATGASPAVPAIPGIELVKALTSADVFDLEELPTRLVVVGGGPQGIELAQAFRRLGSEVTLLDSGRMLGREDPELAAAVLAALAQEGVVLRQNVAIARIEPRGAGVRLFLSGGLLEATIDGSHLLLAAGRRPNVDGLGLEAAGVAFGRAGIEVRADMRTTNSRIWALGDVAGQPGFAHGARDHAATVLRALMPGPALPPRPLPRVTFADPELAAVGLDEAQALARKLKFDVLRWPFSQNDRARTEGRTRGLIKVVVDRRGRILGAGMAGRGAGELIGLWTLALAKGMNIADIAALALPYPTRGEISRDVALPAAAVRLRRSWLARLLAPKG